MTDKPETTRPTLAEVAADTRRRVLAGEAGDAVLSEMQRATGFDRYKIEAAAFPADEIAWRNAVASATPTDVWAAYEADGYSRREALDEEMSYAG